MKTNQICNKLDSLTKGLTRKKRSLLQEDSHCPDLNLEVIRIIYFQKFKNLDKKDSYRERKNLGEFHRV